MKEKKGLTTITTTTSGGTWNLTEEQIKEFNDSNNNYIGDFVLDIDNDNIGIPNYGGGDILQQQLGQLQWSNNAILPISIKISDDGLRELTLHSDGSLTIKHVNTNSLMDHLDREMYNQMLHDNNMIKHLEDEETGEARKLELGEEEE